MYELLAKLEALIEKWENTPATYSGDSVPMAKRICANELRDVIGTKEDMRWHQDRTSNDMPSQKGYFDDECPF